MSLDRARRMPKGLVAVVRESLPSNEGRRREPCRTLLERAVSSVGQSASFTPRRSLVRVQYRPPSLKDRWSAPEVPLDLAFGGETDGAAVAVRAFSPREKFRAVGGSGCSVRSWGGTI